MSHATSFAPRKAPAEFVHATLGSRGQLFLPHLAPGCNHKSDHQSELRLIRAACKASKMTFDWDGIQALGDMV